ncbi:MAG TPA: TauD/TfdA family dioxygenase [Pseudonocardiaceae bacterium]|jgi:alpha-ketoglutarate-dependent taurine dioxygenase|nr:TauD/TfdA family dioxygenase [Pseudonocardiaceae bacterium]
MRVNTMTSGRTTVAVIEPPGADLPADPARLTDELGSVVGRANELLLTHGAVLLRGFGIGDPAAVRAAVSCFGEPFNEYLHGNSPRNAVHDGVWTSTEYPAEYDISLHNELSQSHRWPDRLYFCCLVAPAGGGQTPVSDGRAMLAEMDTAVRARFEAHGVAYLQNMHGGFGLGRSWQETYETDDAEKVTEYLRAADVSHTWTEDEELRIRQVRPATRVHPVTGDEVWFNQADQFHISNLPPDQAQALQALVESDEELPLHATFGDGGPIPADDLAHVRDVARRNEFAFGWRPGDLMMIDNMLVLHGRHAYTGSRRVLVSMT